jgi:hypothetical protein
LKVTLDSAESLQDALRVVGALYDVRLVVADGDDEPARGSGQASAAKGGGRRSRKPAPSISTSELRAWARSTGLDVNERGPVPASVREAYNAAN